MDQEASEPDPHIVDLNADLVTCDEYASSTLPVKERRYVLAENYEGRLFNASFRFVFEGLSHLMERLLISNARRIRAMNHNGVQKMLRNILALQQNIKIIAEGGTHVDFERSKRYYMLFLLSPPVGDKLCFVLVYSDPSCRTFWTPYARNRSLRSKSTRPFLISNVASTQLHKERRRPVKLQTGTIACISSSCMGLRWRITTASHSDGTLRIYGWTKIFISSAVLVATLSLLCPYPCSRRF